MKKTFKKFTSVILVTLILALSVPLQSFAAFESIKIPVIEKIEINEDSSAVSLKEVERYYTEMIAVLEKNGIEIEHLKDTSPSFLDNLFKFHLYSSCFEYKFDMTLTSGKEYTFSSKDYDSEINRLYSLEIDAFITYESYLEAKEAGAKEIQAEIYACLYNNLTYDYCYATSYTSKDTLSLTQMVVKSITPLSGIPDKFYQDQTYVDIDGAEFLIEYADGKTVTAAAKASTENSKHFTEYTLDGASIEVYCDFIPLSEDECSELQCEFCFDYLDASFKTSAAYVEESLLKGIKITDCIFDTESLHLSSLAYELTYADGSTASFTKEFSSKEDIFSELVTQLTKVDGYVVELFITVGDFDADSEKINADAYYFTVRAGEASDTYKVDNPYKDAMNAPLNVIWFFVNLFSKIEDFLYNILNFFAF